MAPLINSKLEVYIRRERQRNKLLKRYQAVNCDLRLRARKRLEDDLRQKINKLESEKLHFLGMIYTNFKSDRLSRDP